MERTIISKILDLQGKPRSLLAKLTLSTACLVCLPLHIGFQRDASILQHLVYSFCHTNIFHLAINLIVLWSIRNEIRPIASLFIAIVASFLPMYVSDPTMGLSGLLFSSFGLMWGKTGRWLDAIKKVMPFVLGTMLIPNVNGTLHLYSFSLGLILGYTSKAAAHHE